MFVMSQVCVVKLATHRVPRFTNGNDMVMGIPYCRNLNGHALPVAPKLLHSHQRCTVVRYVVALNRHVNDIKSLHCINTHHLFLHS